MFRKLILIISALVVSSLSYAGTGSAAEVAGTYVLKLGEESAALCRLLQTPVPESRLVLTEDAQYRMERSLFGRVQQSTGAFEVQRGVLILFGKRNVKASVQPGTLILDGLVYERVPGSELVGTWVVRQSNGFTDTQSKFTFTDKGTFRYKGLGGTSSGTYELEGGTIYLNYMEVDGERVSEPFRGRAYRSGEGFKIDRYRFVRA